MKKLNFKSQEIGEYDLIENLEDSQISNIFSPAAIGIGLFWETVCKSFK